MTIALNADVGEGLDSDRDLYPYLQQASIACGGHAGDSQTMRSAVQACLHHGVMIGAHPSYPDKANFGRVSQSLESEQLGEEIHSQVGVLQVVCNESGALLRYLKPHGALYNDMMTNVAVFQSVLQAVAIYPAPLSLMIGAMPIAKSYISLAREAGVSLIVEAFADRLYLDNGQLCARTQAGAVFDQRQKIVAQVRKLVEHQQVISEGGKALSIVAQSICLHGDNPASVAAIEAIAEQLINSQD